MGQLAGPPHGPAEIDGGRARVFERLVDVADGVTNAAHNLDDVAEERRAWRARGRFRRGAGQYDRAQQQMEDRPHSPHARNPSPRRALGVIPTDSAPRWRRVTVA